MQYINHWPNMAEFTLPETVAQDLQHHLLQPFDSVREAKDFWDEAPSTIIILESSDSIEGSKVCKQIEFILVRVNITLVFNNCSQTYPVNNQYPPPYPLNFSTFHHHKTGQHPENSLNPNTKNPYHLSSNGDQ